MNVPLITMDRDAARAKLKAFRADRHKDAEAAYGRAATAYEALAAGTPLLNLSAAIQAGGLFDDWRPRLAVARADRSEVCFRWRAGSTVARFSAQADVNQAPPEGSLLVRNVDMGRKHGKRFQGRNGPYAVDLWGYALVPMVPADVRPKTGRLADWLVLWEVTQWFDRPQRMQAPVDPLLLKPLGGELYAVLAQWDLTEVERLVLQELHRR